MNTSWRVILFGALVLLAGCDPMPVHYPPGSAQHPYSNPTSNPNANTPQSQPQVTGSQRWQHAWSKAMEGIAMGGSIGGPYGAGGGLLIGLITGLLTADSHYGALSTQIQTEQQKDLALEAAIEQELERQRSLENQVAQASTPNAGSGSEVQPVAQASKAQPAMSQSKPLDNTSLASLGKPPPPTAPPTPFKNMEVKDMNGDGVPDLWVYYNPEKPGEIVRQEESTKADGRVDTWSYFKGGKLVRREVDSKAQGRPDAVFYYEDDKIAREERDENGQGRMTYRATYHNGRIAKVEKDTTGRGAPDLWVHYDTSKDGEAISKEERDLNGDGVADLWTYYDNGRVVRRDVSALGLEVLSKLEEIPAAGAELRNISVPGS
jgi:hypothetical protein